MSTTRIALCGFIAATSILVGCPTPDPQPDAAVTPDAFEPVDARVRPDAWSEPARPIGDACTASGGGGAPVQGTCSAGQLCLTDRFGFADGYCTQLCSGSARCPTDSVCVTAGGGTQVCLRSCTTPSDCRVDVGYTCGGTAGQRVCIPNDGPVGTRDGEACFTRTAGPHQLADTPVRTFATNLSASEARTDSASEAEGNVAINPMSSAVAISYIGVQRAGSFMGSSFTPDGVAFTRTGAVRDPIGAGRLTSDPVLAYTADGTLHMVFLGYGSAGGNPVDMRVYVAESTDNGATWATAVQADPAGFCVAGGASCDKPWIAVGPAPGGMGPEHIYIAFMRQTGTGIELVSQRSTDGGTVWSAPVRIAGVEAVSGAIVGPNLNTLVVAPNGDLNIAYSGLSISGDMRFGGVGNRVLFRRSTDGGATWAATSSAAAMGEPVIYGQPGLAVLGTSVHVVYVAGQPTGAWDVMLASSTDQGVTWTRRKVNDEPESCATHFQPSIAADPTRNLIHAFWLDNRFGDGQASYAACPSDATMPCGTNERVSSESFTLATARDPNLWHGDYSGIAVTATGEVWAGWSDTRSATPSMYLARGAP